MSKQFGARTEKFVTTCGECGASCSQQVNYGGGLLVLRNVCPACGGVTYQEIADKVGVSVYTAHSAARDVELLENKKLIGAVAKCAGWQRG